MYLVIYPVDSVFDRHDFDNYDTNVPAEAKEVFKQLYKTLHNDYSFDFYNMSSVSHSTRHKNLDDFVEDSNNEEIYLDGSWLIWLNLTEDDVLSVIEECQNV